LGNKIPSGIYGRKKLKKGFFGIIRNFFDIKKGTCIILGIKNKIDPFDRRSNNSIDDLERKKVDQKIKLLNFKKKHCWMEF